MDVHITRRSSPRSAFHLLPTSKDISCPALLLGSHPGMSAARSQDVSKTAWSACGVLRQKKASLWLSCPQAEPCLSWGPPHMRSHGCCPSSTSVLQGPHPTLGQTPHHSRLSVLPLVHYLGAPFNPSVTYPRVSWLPCTLHLLPCSFHSGHMTLCYSISACCHPIGYKLHWNKVLAFRVLRYNPETRRDPEKCRDGPWYTLVELMKKCPILYIKNVIKISKPQE